jgi:polysaccharide export outer membrane protein
MKNLIRQKNLWLLIFTATILFSGCVSQKKSRLIRDLTSQMSGSSFENKKLTTYHIQSGDHLYIKILSVDPKTSKFFQTDMPALMNPTYLYLNSYVVDEDGYIAFSFIEKMQVKGLTIEQVRVQLQKTISDYFKEASVIVRLVNYQVAVLGEVNIPGNFTIDRDQINLFQAIGLAAGFKQYADLKKVKIIRQTQVGSEVYVVDVTQKDILQNDYFYLLPNDVVYVEPRSAKSFALDKLDYGVFLSIISASLAIIAITKK